MPYRLIHAIAFSGCLVAGSPPAAGDETERAAVSVLRFEDWIRPILERHCYSCHGNDTNEGGVTLDKFADDAARLDPELWLRVLRNVRAELMPPAGEKRLPPSDSGRKPWKNDG